MHLTSRSLPIRGVCDVHSSQRMTPMEYMSTFSVKGLLTRSSGACEANSGSHQPMLQPKPGQLMELSLLHMLPCSWVEHIANRTSTTTKPQQRSNVGLHGVDHGPCKGWATATASMVTVTESMVMIPVNATACRRNMSGLRMRLRRELRQHSRDLAIAEHFCFVLGVRTDHARVPGLATVGAAWSRCRSFDMPTSQIFAFSDRSSRTVACTQQPVKLACAALSPLQRNV